MQITLNSIFETLKSDVKVSIMDNLRKYEPVSGYPAALSKKLEEQEFCPINSISVIDNCIAIEIETSTYEAYFVKCTKDVEAKVLQKIINHTVGQDYFTTEVGKELQETARQLIEGCSFVTEEEEKIANQLSKLPVSVLTAKAQYLDPEKVQKIAKELDETEMDM